MATLVELQVVPGRIFQVVKERILANRKRLQDSEEGRRLARAATRPRVQRRRDGATLNFYRRPEPAATRSGESLVPFAISWRGKLTEQETVTLDVTEIPPTFEYVDGVELQYSGGDSVAPGPFSIATQTRLITVSQPFRYTQRQTIFNPYYLETYYNPPIKYYTYHSPQVFDGFHGETLRNTNGESVRIQPTASLQSPVGPKSHSPSSYLAVSVTGTIFLTVSLPKVPVDVERVEFPVKLIYVGSGSGASYPLFSDGGLFTDGVPNGYEGPYYYPNVLSPGVLSSKPEPYMFLQINGTAVQSKIAEKPSSQSWGDFYMEHCYSGDPSRELRAAGYQGEVRIRGNQAHLLRMRYTETEGSETYTYYEGFPFTSLASLVTGSGSGVTLKPNVSFEDHLYNLQPYDSSEELADQLNGIWNPTYVQDQPELLPQRVIPVNASSMLLSPAAAKLSTTGDELTPPTYFAVLR